MKYYSKNYKNLNSVFTVKVRLYSAKYFLLFMFSSFFLLFMWFASNQGSEKSKKNDILKQQNSIQ